MADAVVVIPARWASTRFPGKVLAPLGGKPLLLWVADIARRARRVGEIIVAADDERILAAARDAGHRAWPTRGDHPSGTDRVAEVAAQLEAEIVLGVQADEPFLDPADLDDLTESLAAPAGPGMATLSAPLDGARDWLDPNTVKVVVDRQGRALLFSRSPIPYQRPADGGRLSFPPAGDPPALARKHIGVYGWRRSALLEFVALPPSPLEQAEGLEQLRALEAGWTIQVRPSRSAPLGVDTPDDLARAERRLAQSREPR